MNLKRILNLNRNEACGLDIGTSSVKIIALRKDDKRYKVTAAGISHIADRHNGSQRQGTGHDSLETNIVKAIHRCYVSTRLKAGKRLRTKLAVCGVSGPEIAVRDFEFPLLSKDEIEGAVSLESEQVCPFNPEQAAIDYQLISSNDNKTKGILVAATNTLIKSKKQMVQKAGLKCVLMDVDGLALLNCFNNLVYEDEKSTTAILNVGGSYTTLAIMSDDGWPFIRETARAGDYIVNKIAEANNISTEEVMEILFGDSPNGQINLSESLKTASKDVIADVSETLRFYAASEKSKQIEKIFICGGFAPTTGFVELLSSSLGIEACLWNPFESVLCHTSDQYDDFFRKKGPAMAVAAGLAMRSIQKSS
jgi:type IV pilus assembly protein PilM